MRCFFVRGPFNVIALLDARVQFIADILATLGDTDSKDHRRVKALAVLANPHEAVALIEAFVKSQNDKDAPETPEIDWRTVLPTVHLFVHTYTGSDPTEDTGVARVEGHGPVTETWLRRHLGPTSTFIVKPVIDIAGQAPVDAYEIPQRHRQAVHLMTPADTFPWGASTRRTQQTDHTEPWQRHGPAGQSRVGNYGPMTTFHHRIKTHGGWQVTQPYPGVYVWRDPHGATYVVDHSGTRRVGQAVGVAGFAGFVTGLRLSSTSERVVSANELRFDLNWRRLRVAA